LIGGIGFHSYDFGSVLPQHQSKNRSFSDFAVLYRTSGQSKIFSNVFELAGIPHQVASRENLFLADGISELISLLKILSESGTYIDFERTNKITKVGINKRNVEIFKRWGYRNSFTLEEALFNARRLPIKGMSRKWQTTLNGSFDELLSMKTEIKEKFKNIGFEYYRFFCLMRFAKRYGYLCAQHRKSVTYDDARC
jgi:superfamily I DNA/RNA helicase